MKRVAFLISLFILINWVVSATAVNAEYNINSGGTDITALDGTAFVADKAYVSGDFGYTDGRNFRFNSAIANTNDDALYQNIRGGSSFSYVYDIADGDYDVTLYFMEPWQSSAGERLFDVTIEGALVLDEYDIYAEAGGTFTAVNTTIPVTVSDGQLNIDFAQSNRVALISAIAVIETGSATPEPEITLSPTSLDYGQVAPGSTSDLTVTITNDGTADLNVSALTIDNSVFTVESPTAPVVIGSGNSEVVTIRFSPSVDGVESGNLDIASDDADEANVSVELTGEGFTLPPNAPEITVSPTSLDFGTIAPGSTTDLTVNIANDGTVDLNVSSLTTDNSLFTVESPTAPVVIAAGNNSDVTVRYSPVVDGTDSGNLTIASDDADESSVVVSLGGSASSTPAVSYHINSAGSDYTAVNGNFFVADKAYVADDFGYSGNGRTFSFSDAIANTNDDTLYQTIRSAFTLTYLFDVDNGEYDVTLYFVEPFQSGPGERNFDVTIEDVLVLDDYDIYSAAGGMFTAVTETFTVDVTDGQINIDMARVNRVAMVAAISVEGTDGTPPAPEQNISVSPTSLDFGDVVTGSDSDMTVTISNVGDADLEVTDLATDNTDFAVVSPSAPVTIGAGGTQDVTVRFTPSATGSASGNMDITSDDPDEGVVSVSLSGNGIDQPVNEPDIALNTTSLAFGSVLVGNSSDLVVTISNTGTQTLTVSSLTSSNTDYTISASATPFIVVPSGSEDVTVTFTPATIGSVIGDLTIDSDDLDESSLIVSLTGTGTDVSGTTFADVTSQIGMNINHTLDEVVCVSPPLGSGSAWSDYDNDGDIDFFATNHGGANWFYRNDGDTDSDGLPNYTNIASTLGVEDAALLSHSANFIDYDNDGDQDLYVTQYDGNTLYQNQLIESGSATFIDVANTAGLVDDGRAITSVWADFDNDGWLDVYLPKHLKCAGDPVNQDRLFQNNGDGTFTDVSSYMCGGASTCSGLEGLGFTAAFFDMDEDGDLDLYVVNDNVGGIYETNQLWRNDGSDGSGGWTFTNVSVGSGADLDVNGMGLAVGDYDNDGLLDLAFSDFAPAHLLKNDGDGTFTETSVSSNVDAITTDDVTWGTAFLDHDNDGWLDLFLMSGNVHQPAAEDPNVFMTNNGDGTFSDASAASGLDNVDRGRSATMADFDLDGYVDLFAGNYGYPALIYRNQSGDQGNTNNWIAVTVEGTESNRDGIGTRLTLTANGMTQIRDINSGPTHGGGDYRAAYFGMGSDTNGTLVIDWPNGESETINIGAGDINQYRHEVEPSSGPPPATDFVDVTAVAGLSGTHDLGLVCEPPIGSGSAWGDYDNDGDVDLYITNRGGNNWFYRNDGDTDSDGVPNFTDVAVSLGVELSTGASMAATFIDYDNDGDQDLFVSNWENDNTEGTYPGSSLFENQLTETGSVSFIELAGTGLDVVEGRVITAAWADINEDGFLDVFLTKHKECSANEGDNMDQLFTNNGDGTFTDVTSWLCGGASSCTAIDAGLGFSPSFVDYDNDGDLDIYLVNDIIGGEWHPNTLWRNDGAGCSGWCFTDVSVSSGTDAALNGMGLAVGDYDNDGFFDFAFSNIGPVGVLHNEGDGTFTDASASSGVASNTTGVTWATVFIDHNNDGWLDLYAVAGGLLDSDPVENYFLLNDGTGNFTNYNTQSGLNDDGRARSASVADFNGDGWMDVFVGNYGEPFALYLNQNTEQGNVNHYLSFTVEGTESNRDGIGTRIIVTANGVTQMREINTGPTHGGGDQRIALFGLGAETSATVTVQWPNGEVENLGVVTADQQMHLVEPASTP